MPDGTDPDPILGVDNISLELPIAGVGSRALAAGIDYLLVGAATVTTWFVIAVLTGMSGAGFGWLLALGVISTFAIGWAYFIGLEVTRCRTVGKGAVGLRVVGSVGGTPSASALVLRNVFREIDLIVGVPLIFFDSRCRRLGDRVAGTLVVHDRTASRSIRIGRLPAAWGAREAAVVEALLDRSSQMDPGRAELLARRLVELLERDAPELLPPAAGLNPPLVTLRQALHVSEG